LRRGCLGAGGPIMGGLGPRFKVLAGVRGFTRKIRLRRASPVSNRILHLARRFPVDGV
jgi:hypothetical protein